MCCSFHWSRRYVDLGFEIVEARRSKRGEIVAGEALAEALTRCAAEHGGEHTFVLAADSPSGPLVAVVRALKAAGCRVEVRSKLLGFVLAVCRGVVCRLMYSVRSI